MNSMYPPEIEIPVGPTPVIRMVRISTQAMGVPRMRKSRRRTGGTSAPGIRGTMRPASMPVLILVIPRQIPMIPTRDGRRASVRPAVIVPTARWVPVSAREIFRVGPVPAVEIALIARGRPVVTSERASPIAVPPMIVRRGCAAVRQIAVVPWIAKMVSARSHYSVAATVDNVPGSTAPKSPESVRRIPPVSAVSASKTGPSNSPGEAVKRRTRSHDAAGLSKPGSTGPRTPMIVVTGSFAHQGASGVRHRSRCSQRIARGGCAFVSNILFCPGAGFVKYAG